MRCWTTDLLVAAAGILFLANTLSAQPPEDSNSEPTDKGSPVATKQEGGKVLSLEAARDRAKLMQNIYAATLDVIHHRYFRNDRVTIPARAMEDVFSEIDRQENIKSSWIAVNGRAMSIDHEPEGEFELAAVKAISRGKDYFEQSNDGTYRRVGAIRLGGGCMNCHGRFGSTSTSKRFAGLVIEIPLKPKEASSDK
nr:hypothetical protein [Pirellulaceae bacterium]